MTRKTNDSANSKRLSDKATIKQTVRRLHGEPPKRQLTLRLMALVMVSSWIASVWAWNESLWVVLALSWLVTAHIKHMQGLGLHEASHGLLTSNHRRNEFFGTFIGTMAFVPLSGYRHAHHFHHAHVGTRKDVELWPYNDPTVPRWQRVIAAFCELFLGGIYVPLQFFRATIVSGGFSSKHARRIKAEYALLVGFWGTIFAAATVFGMWQPLLIAYFVPMMFTGFFQTLRKFTEHMGLFGDSALTLTRTIEAKGFINRVLSFSLLHENSHGAHHLFPKVPHGKLNEAARHVYDNATYQPRVPMFANYAMAVMDMLPHLANPRIGKQWIEQTK